MAVTYSKAGRPCLVADIDISEDPDLALWDEFYDVCRSFRYAETMALSRIFKVTDRTIRNWIYGTTYPGDGTARQIIAWAKRGKPMKNMLSNQTVSDML